jgi:HTH-type transcriptional regulator/antitoxin HigA
VKVCGLGAGEARSEDSNRNMTNNEKPSKEYLERLERFLLKPISSDEENERAAEVCDEMLESFDSLSKQERYYFEILSGLVSDYESRWVEERAISPRELLSFLMEQNNLTQTDLISEFGSSSHASKYLSGKRPYLSLNQIAKLSKRFKLSMSAFISQEQIRSSEESIEGPSKKGTPSPGSS